MTTITVNSKNVIQLMDPNINSVSEYTVKFSVFNDVGQYVKNDEDKEIKELATEFENEKKKFYASFKIHPSSKGKYYRLQFHITKGNDFVSSDFSLIDLLLEKYANSAQLIPNAYYLEYIINGELDDDIKEKISAYPKDGVTEFILAAQDELENELEISFVPRTVEGEAHDWYEDNFSDTYWMIQLYRWPVLSIQSYALFYGKEKIMEIKPEYLSLSRETGLLEYIPTPGQPIFNQLQSSSIEAINRISMFSRGGFNGSSRIPNVFQVSYTHGLDFINMEDTEQSGIRMAIARRTMFNSLPRISPEVVTGNEQMAVDGVSYSKFNRGIEYLNMQKGFEKTWIESMKRKYNTGFKIMTI